MGHAHVGPAFRAPTQSAQNKINQRVARPPERAPVPNGQQSRCKAKSDSRGPHSADSPRTQRKRKHHCACAPPRQTHREDRRAPGHLNSRPLICASSCQADLTTRSAQCQVGHRIDGRSIGELPKHKSHSYTQLDLTLVESSRKGPICSQTQRPTRAGHEAQVSIPEPAPHDKSDGVLKFQGGTFLKTFSAG